MNKLEHTLFLTVILLLSSCSVKEDRMPCPSRLTVDASEFYNVSDVVHVRLLTPTRNLRDSIDLRQGQMFRNWEADKGMMTVYAFSNLENSRENNGIVTIPLGEQSDSLRASCHRLDSYEERIDIQARPNRQSALIHLAILDESRNYPYDLQVSGGICGIDLRTMTPQEGEFRYNLSLDMDLSCDFRLPRQKPDSKAVINVFHSGVQIDTFPLYLWMEAAGYDWTADDLPEISLGINRDELRVAISVHGWEHEEYEVIL